MKLRVSRELHERLKACAEAIDEPILRFTRVAVLKYVRGDLQSVANDETLCVATRKDSVPITVDKAGQMLVPAKVREAIVRGVLYAEERNPAPVIPDEVKDGVRFIIGSDEDE